MTKAFSIRPFRNGDEFAICELHVAAIRAVPETVYPRESIEAWADGKTPEIYVKIQKDIGEIFRVAVNKDDHPVGFCGYLDNEIRGLYVHPAWQGKGIGTALMRDAEEKLVAAGANRLVVNAARSAYGFYQHIGYTQTSIGSHTMRNGQKIEAAWYEKLVVKKS